MCFFVYSLINYIIIRASVYENKILINKIFRANLTYLRRSQDALNNNNEHENIDLAKSQKVFRNLKCYHVIDDKSYK